MEFLLIIVAVLIVLFLVWGIAFDLRKRRRNDAVTDHDARAVARRTRSESEGKFGEWGAGL